MGILLKNGTAFVNGKFEKCHDERVGGCCNIKPIEKTGCWNKKWC